MTDASTTQRRPRGRPPKRNGETAAAAPAAAASTGTTADDDAEWTNILASDTAGNNKNAKAPNESCQHLAQAMDSWEDTHLRCRLCQDWLQVPVSVLPCHHWFCSLCIRKALRSQCNQNRTVKPTCPQCRTVLANAKPPEFQQTLVPNRALEQLVGSYLETLRKPLQEQLLCRQRNLNAGATTAGNEQNARASSSTNLGGARDGPSPRAKDTPTDDAARTSYKRQDPSEPAHERPKKKRRIAYGSYKRKALVELCQAEGLDTRGNEDQLQKRHEAFVVFYNAHCDSHSLTDTDIRKKYHNLHRACTTTFATSLAKLKLPQVHAFLRQKYPNLNATFKEMVETVKQRKEMEKQKRDEGKKAVPKSQVLGANREESPADATDTNVDPATTIFASSSSSANETSSSVGLQQAIDTKDELAQQPLLVTDAKRIPPLVMSEASESSCSSSNQSPLPRQLDATILRHDPSMGPLQPANFNISHPSPLFQNDKSSYHSDKLPSNELTSLCNTKTPSPMASSKNSAPVSTSLLQKESSPVIDLVATTDTIAASSDSRTYKKSSSRRKERSEFSVSKNSRSLIGPWHCPTCTFYNVTNRWSSATCEMCQTPRPRPSSGSR